MYTYASGPRELNSVPQRCSWKPRGPGAGWRAVVVDGVPESILELMAGLRARHAALPGRPGGGSVSTRPGQIQPRPAGVLSAPPPGPDSGSPPNAAAAPRSTTFSSGCGSTSLSRERDSPARRWVTGWWTAWVGLSSTAHRPSESRIQRVRRGPVETMASLVQGTSGRCHDTPELVQNVGSLFHAVNLVVPFPRASSPSEHFEFSFVSATNGLLAGFVQRAKIVLLLAEGVSARAVETKLDVRATDVNTLFTGRLYLSSCCRRCFLLFFQQVCRQMEQATPNT